MARIMIVDDSKFMRNIISETIKEAGHEVIVEAENGMDAIEYYKKFKPDIVTMDVTMWGKDGIAAVTEILEIDKNAKIIMISALNEQTMKSTKRDVKAQAFITKPFVKADLIKAIEGLL
ncbi:MAG: response regulator [Spirochaetes bacterium]|nr:response regulator [Spirochaetota bacterium]